VLAVLNSSIAWWFMTLTFPHKKDEALSMDADYLAKFPLPRATEELKAEIRTRCQTLRRVSSNPTPDISLKLTLERELAELVVQAYGLNAQERAVVEKSSVVRDPIGVIEKEFTRPVTVAAPARDILELPLPAIPSGKRQSMDTPAKYVAQFILSMLKLNGGPMDARRMAEAFSLVSSRRLCEDLAKIEFDDLGRNWMRTFNETTSPELFREILCELYDKEIIDLADRDNKPMVSMKIADPIPKNEWVELDVILSARLLAIVPRDVHYENPVAMPSNKQQILAHAA
jgi:hypothetical protein